MTANETPAIALLIDTDPALGVHLDGRPHDVDDAFAIVHAAREPTIELRGLSVVYGNAPLPRARAVLERLHALGGFDAPWIAGSAGPMRSEDGTAEPDPAAADWLAARLREAPARIAALGPLTNIGLLLQRHPDVADRIPEIVFVGGRRRGRRFHIGTTGPVRDFNFENDPEAARIVLAAGVPMTCVGFELTSQLCMTTAELDRIAAHDTPVARALVEGSRDWLEWWTSRFPTDAGFHPWDSAAISWLSHPEWFVAADVTLAVEREADAGAVLNADPVGAGRRPGHRFVTGFTTGGVPAFLDDVVRHCH